MRGQVRQVRRVRRVRRATTIGETQYRLGTGSFWNAHAAALRPKSNRFQIRAVGASPRTVARTRTAVTSERVNLLKRSPGLRPVLGLVLARHHVNLLSLNADAYLETSLV